MPRRPDTFDRKLAAYRKAHAMTDPPASVARAADETAATVAYRVDRLLWAVLLPVAAALVVTGIAAWDHDPRRIALAWTCVVLVWCGIWMGASCAVVKQGECDV